jgi:glutathione S-transferase
MHTLWYVPRTRATRPRWVLEELGLPYTLQRIEPSQTRTPEHLARHPLGHVPVLQHNDDLLFESAALCLQLADAKPEAGLNFQLGSYERGLVYQWVLYASTELEPPCVRLFSLKAAPDAAAEAAAKKAATHAVAVLGEVLTSKEFLVGSRFSVADIVCGAVCLWAQRLGAFEEVPAVSAWLLRLKARPAFQRAFAD